MRVKAEQIATHLKRGLAPVYIVSGDEPLQMGECLDAVRAAARTGGYTDRVVFELDGKSDWSAFQGEAQTLSLFSDRRILDLRLRTGSPGTAGARVLKDYAEHPNADNVLVVVTPRLEKRIQGSQWYKALDKAGVSVQVWPVDAKALAAWTAHRAGALGMRLSPQGAELLAERSEGNLLACVQELEKLRLLHGEAEIGVEQVLSAVVDSSRYGAFDLVDGALAGEAGRVVHMLRVLREEGLDPLPVLGALAWALRACADIAAQTQAGRSLDAALRGGHGAWWGRKQVLTAALRRHNAAAWQRMLRAAAGIDRIVKGAPERVDAGVKWGADDAWDGLERLVLCMCGVNIVPAPPYNHPVG